MKTPSIQVTSPTPRTVWNDLLQADAEALPDQSPAWVDCICATGNYEDASRLYEFTNGQQIVLPMVRRMGLPTPLRMEGSLAHGWGFGGWIASSPPRCEEVAALCTDLSHRHILRTSIRPNPRQGTMWSAAVSSNALAATEVAHVLNLSGGFDYVWANCFSSSKRNHIRKAERAELVVECDTSGRLIPIFYHLLQLSVERWANQQHEPLLLARWRNQQIDSLSKLQLTAQFLGENCRTWVAWRNAQPAAAIIVVYGKNAHYFRGAMNKEIAGPVYANDLLHKLAIEEACRIGCNSYHMGCSGTLTSSLAHYKGRFGAEPYSYAEYHLERLPLAKIDRSLRGIAKRLMGFEGS